MSIKNKKRVVYALLFCFFLLIEVLIALFVHDTFVRPYLGDVLVIILLCLLVRILFPEKIRCLGLFGILFGVVAELLQLIRLDKLLGLEGTVFSIALGATFDFADILCYIVGGMIFFLAEKILLKREN